MPVFNYPGKEVNIKVVYYGPGLSGKTTNIQYIHGNIRPDFKGKLVSLATQTDRTLFFDFLPMELGVLGGYKIRLHLYTVPGQVHYNATRKLVLKGVDGVVLVADSQRAMREANQESLKNLEKNLESYGKNLRDLPHVIQCNKRDLDDLLSLDELKDQLNPYNAPVMEAVASEGKGVLECLREILRLVMKSLRDQFPPQDEPVPPPEPEPEPPGEEELSTEPAGEPEEPEVIPEVPKEKTPQISEPEATVVLEAPETAASTGGDSVIVRVPIPGGGEMEVAVQVTARLTKAPVSAEAAPPEVRDVPEEEIPEETASEVETSVPEPVLAGSEETAPNVDNELPSEELDVGEVVAELDNEMELDTLEAEPYDPSFKELRFTDFDGDEEVEDGKGKRRGLFGRLRKKK